MARCDVLEPSWITTNCLKLVTQSYKKENQDRESRVHRLRWLHRGVAAPSVMVSVVRTKRHRGIRHIPECKGQGGSVNNVSNYACIKWNVIHIGLELSKGTFVNKLRKVICSETMAWKRGVITWIQPRFCQTGYDN